MKRILRIALPVLVLALGLFLAGQLASMREEPVTVLPVVPAPFVQTAEVQTETRRPKIHSQGTVEPSEESDLVSQVSGRIEWVAPELVDGGFFNAGALLVRIEATEYELRIVRARAELARAELRLAEEEAQGEVARAEWSHMGSAEASPLTLREPQLAEARANVAAAKASVAEAELQLSRTELRAPFTGRVRSEAVDRGSYATPGQRLARIYSLAASEVRLPLPDDKIGLLDLPLGLRAEESGAKVELWASFGGEPVRWDAKIVRTGGSIDPATRMIQAVAQVVDPYGLESELDHPPLAVGLFVQAEIQGRAYEGLSRIPRSAVRDGGEVLVVGVEERLSARVIEPLFSDRDWVWVEGGLSQGERVVTSQLEAFVEGMQVQISGEVDP